MKNKLLLLFVLFITSKTNQAQEIWSKSFCVQKAIENNFQINILKNNVAINTLGTGWGWAGALPSITFSLGNNSQYYYLSQFFTNRDPIIANGVISNNLTSNLSFSLNIFNGFYAKITYQKLNELKLKSEKDLQQQIQQITAEVLERYFDIVRQQNFITTLKSIVRVNEEKLKINFAKEKIGLGNQTDISLSQLDLNYSTQSIENQNNIINKLKISLCSLMGMPPDTTMIIADTIIIPLNLQIDSILAKLPLSPPLLSLASQIKITSLSGKQLNALGLPKLSLNSGYYLTNNQSTAGFSTLTRTHGPLLNLNLSVPIYGGGVVKKQLQINKIQNTNAQLSYNQQLNIAQSNVYSLFYEYKNNLQQVTNEKTNISINEDLLDQLLEKYKLGAATIVELEQAQQNLAQSYFQLTNYTYQAYYAAIELLKLQGLLSIN